MSVFNMLGKNYPCCLGYVVPKYSPACKDFVEISANENMIEKYRSALQV